MRSRARWKGVRKCRDHGNTVINTAAQDCLGILVSLVSLLLYIWVSIGLCNCGLSRLYTQLETSGFTFQIKYV